MNTVEAGRFRKTLIIIMSIAFTGALLVYTSQSNLDLLQKVYVNPQYVIFGMLALEGGVIYWTGYYLLHWDGVHKAIAVTMAVIDFLLSAIGFFMDGNLHTGDQIHTALPPVLIVMSFDVLLNVGIGLLIHFLIHSKPAVQQGNLIPAGRDFNSQRGNLIPQQQGQVVYSQADMQRIAEQITRQVTGHLVAVIEERENHTDPLAQRQLPRPQQQGSDRQTPRLPQVQQEESDPLLLSMATVRRVASSLMRRRSRSTKSGEQAAPAPGDQSETTSESGSDPSSSNWRVENDEPGKGEYPELV